MANRPSEINLRKQDIIESYLRTTSKATFTNFVAKKRDAIAEIEVGATSALSLQRHWTDLYNQLTSKNRTTAKLARCPPKASLPFRGIYKKLKALNEARLKFEVESISTLGEFSASASSSLRRYHPNNEEEAKEDDEENEEAEEAEEHEDDEENEDSEEEENMDIEEAVSDSQELCQLLSQLRQKAKDKILHHTVQPPIAPNIPQKRELSFVLLKEAARLLDQPKLEYEDVELLKLCLSRCVNVMNADYCETYKASFDTAVWESIMTECEKRRCLPADPVFEVVDDLFDALLEFRFEKNTKKVIQYLDEQKVAEVNKDSERYKLLRVVQQVVYTFNFWAKESGQATGSYSESMYLRKFADLLDILFEDEDVTIYDGETISEAAKSMQILNDDDDSSGRRMDLLSKTEYNETAIDVSSTEFKRQTASAATCQKQQSKNIRINSAIANNIYNITKKKLDVEYMDWRGRVGYISQLFFFEDVIVAHQLETLYIPKLMLELDDFRATLKRLIMWRKRKSELVNKIRLAAFQEQRKYIAADISTAQCHSPRRSPVPVPMVMPFFSPVRNTTVSNKRKLPQDEDEE